MTRCKIGLRERISWARNCKNGWAHKILVILGLRHSPTLEQLHSFYGVDLREAFLKGVESVEAIVTDEKEGM